MSKLDGNLQVYIDEANINYQNSRFRDSANTFSNIALSCQRDDLTIDALYFSYRAALGYERDNDRIMVMRELSRLATYLLRTTATMTSELIGETEDLRDRLSLMQKMESLLGHLMKDEERRIVIQSIIDICNQLIGESNADNRLEYLDVLRKYLEFMDDEQRGEVVRKQVDTYMEIAENYKGTGEKEKDDPVRIHYLKKALNLAEGNMVKRINKLISSMGFDQKDLE